MIRAWLPGIGLIGIRVQGRPALERPVGRLPAHPLGMAPAPAFYRPLAAAMRWPDALPALRGGTPAVLDAVRPGLAACATCEPTSYATLRDRAWE